MAHLTNLKEHIIHLMEEADEGTIMGLIKVLEAGADGKPLVLTPRSRTAVRNHNGNNTKDSGNNIVKIYGVNGDDSSSRAGSPTNDDDSNHNHRDGRVKSVTLNSDNPLVEENMAPLSDDGSPRRSFLSDSDNQSSVNYFQRRDTGASSESGVHEGNSTKVLEAVEAQLGSSGHRGRRAGVSAAPMADFLQEQVAKQSFEARKIPKTEEQRQKVSEICNSVMFFSSMDPKDRDIVIDALDREEFAPGTEILTQDQVPNPAKFYVCFEGTCEVVIDGRLIASLVPGNTFGELEMMYSTPCKATVRTVTECVMYSLDQATYQVIVYATSKRKREQFEHLVQQVSFFEALSDYDKSTLAEALTTKEFFSGDFLIRFGEKGENMFIIMEGEVQVVGRDKGKKVDVIRLGPDNVVGELEFLFDHSTIADVVAVSKKVKTATISRKHFEMCVGITDDLKQFVAKKGNYGHYLKEADDKVKREIETLDKRVARVEAGTDLKIEKLDNSGEIILTQDVGHRDNTKKVAYRYPLRPVQDRTATLLFGIREDDTVMFWSDGMERLTSFPSSEVIGKSVHILMHGTKDQNNFHAAIHSALKLAGKIDEEFYEKLEAQTYTIQRRDGLTKVKLQLRIVPPSVAHSRNVPEMMLVIGEEIKQAPPQLTTDYSRWVTDQIRTIINDAQSHGDNKLAKINQTLVKFEQLQKSASHVDNSKLTVVNLRQMIGSVVTDFSGDCISRGIPINQRFDLSYEEVYCDPTILLNCLRQAMKNCMTHLPMNSNVIISCSQIEEHTVEFLQIEFIDNGPGFPAHIIAAVNGTGGGRVRGALMELKEGVESLGGELRIESYPPNTSVLFKFPFFPYTNEDDSDGVDLATSTTMTSVGNLALNKPQSYTSLVVEDHAAYRNMICSALWERKHAVLPGYTWDDIELRRELADILFIDTSQSVMVSDPSRITELAKMAKNSMAVIVTGEHVSKAFEEKDGFLTLQKPFTGKQLTLLLRKAEDRVHKLKAEKERVNAARAAFNQNSRTGNYVLGKMLGKGAFGEVYEATDSVTGGIMAVKLLRINAPEKRQEVINEIEVMCTLNHPNIIHYLFAQDDPENNLIKVIMEFASGGTLQDQMAKKAEKGEPFDMKEYVTMLRHIVEGVAYVHGQNIVHRDLKTPNVLLDAAGKGKLGDFGTAKRLQPGEQLYDMTGTLNYMAPEVLSAGEIIPDGDHNLAPGEDLTEAHGTKQGYSFPADIWSLGCVALEMATGQPPFAHLGVMTSMASITNFITSLRDVPDLSPLFEKPPAIIDFVSACLHPDPTKRLKANQLLEHNIFQEGNVDEKAAMKALKRAQLMAVLNAFVAFQEPEEIEARRVAEEEARKVREIIANPKAAKKAVDDFFADSDEDEEEEDEEGEDGSDDDGSDDDSDSGKKNTTPRNNNNTSAASAATPVATGPTGTPTASSAPPIVAPLRFGVMNAQSPTGPTPPNSGRARPISFGIVDGPSPTTPRGTNAAGGDAAATGVSPTTRNVPAFMTPTSAAAAIPIPAAPMNTNASNTTPASPAAGGTGGGILRKTTSVHIPSTPPTAGTAVPAASITVTQSSSAPSLGAVRGSPAPNTNGALGTVAEAMAAGGMSGLFQPLAFAPDALMGTITPEVAKQHRDETANGTGKTAVAAGGSSPSPSAAAAPATSSATSGNNNNTASAVSDQLIISLHDALLMLVDELNRTNSKVQKSDALKEQYEALRRRREQSPPFGNSSRNANVVGGGGDASGGMMTFTPTEVAAGTTTGVQSPSPNTTGGVSSGGGGNNKNNMINFRPDIDKLLEADVAFVKSVVAALAASSAASNPSSPSGGQR